MTTTPQETQRKFAPNMFESMRKYMGEAVQNREEFYKGLDEAEYDWRNSQKNSPYTAATNVEAARQIFRSSAKGKEFIANNRWNMMQAVMFGIADIAINLRRGVIELYHIRKILEQQHGAYTVPQQRGRRDG